MPKSLKDPIKHPVIPKSDDEEAILWLTNWLNNRRQQIYNNFNSYPYGNQIEIYNKPKELKRGDIREDGWRVNRIENIYNPLEYFKGNDPNRIRTNKIFYGLINNAASAPQYIIYPDTKNSEYDTRGMYVEPNSWNNTGHYIVYPGTPNNGTNIHERTHAMNPKHQEYVIKKFIEDNDNNYNDKYLDKPEEIYGRLMQYRYNNKLSPTKIIDKKYLNTHKEELEKLNLRRYDDDFLLKLFNEVAENNIERKSLENLNYA